MKPIHSTGRFAKYTKEHYSHAGMVRVLLETTETGELEIVENYKGQGFTSQGVIESIPKDGYDHWKEGIRKGIEYAYSKLAENKSLKVIVIEGEGRIGTDTNPTIIGYAASRAVLNELPHSESEEEQKALEELVLTSFSYDHSAIPDFMERTISNPPEEPKPSFWEKVKKSFR